MKKSFKVAFAAVCLIVMGVFIMGCTLFTGSKPGSENSTNSGSDSDSGNGSGSGSGSGTGSGSGSGSGNTPPVNYIGTKAPGTTLVVGDIVFNDGSATPYSKIASRSPAECTDVEKAAAIAVIFRVGDGTEGNKTLGVGIKHEYGDGETTFGIAWCIDSADGYEINFSDLVCDPDVGSSETNPTFFQSPNTDGSRNLAKMIKAGADDTGIVLNNDGTINFNSSIQTTLKTNYPAFEFAYFYGKNEGHNTKGTAYETGWYLPSLSELNDIFQANKTDSIVKKALSLTGVTVEFNWYWSSSQYYDNNASACNFDISGASGTNFNDCAKEDDEYYVCAIRAFN